MRGERGAAVKRRRLEEVRKGKKVGTDLKRKEKGCSIDKGTQKNQEMN